MPSIHTITITEAQIYKEYQIAASGSASSPQQLAFLTDQSTGNNRQSQRVLVEARGDNIVFNFGGSSVTASKTVTSNALPNGNFSVPSGAIYSLTLNGLNQNYVSVIAETTTGTAIIRLASANL